MSTIAIDVLPVLCPLRASLELVLKGIQGSDDLVIRHCSVHASVELLVSLLRDKGLVVLLGLTVSVFLFLLFLLFNLYYVLAIVLDALNLKTFLLFFHLLKDFLPFLVNLAALLDLFVKVIL